MAQRVITQLVSDLSGDEIADGEGGTLYFSFDGTKYSIDLTNKEAADFEKAIAMYIAHATKVGGRRRQTRSRGSSGYSSRDVRAWARDNGLDVPARGRIPAELVEQYRQAH